jgi:predicted ATPase
MVACQCAALHHRRRIVLTGGPGAGKTAILELVRQHFCPHVHVLKESASIVFGGGFPRDRSSELSRAAQRAIFYVQRELEAVADVGSPAIAVCDRGTVDSSAYWPGPDEFWAQVGTTEQEQLARYDTVVHLRTPPLDEGYNQGNPLRLESAEEAAAIDERILQCWAGHSRRFVIDAVPDFLVKAARVLDIIGAELPECCRVRTTR